MSLLYSTQEACRKAKHAPLHQNRHGNGAYGDTTISEWSEVHRDL